MRLPRTARWIPIVAVALAAACGADDESAVGPGAADAGIDRNTVQDALADTAIGSGGVLGSGGTPGTGGAAGGSGAAGSGGTAGTSADSGAGDDAPVDTASDAGDASDSSPDTVASDASDADASDAGVVDACADCWIRDKFPDGGPGTITVTGTIRKNDNVCVIVFGGGQCQAQNSPPCNLQSGQSTITLDLTLDAAGKLTVEAPYQDMCAPDYFCAVSGPGCPIPTSYGVPTDTTFSYVPRSTDRCRRDLQGRPYNVSHEVAVRISGRSLIVDQLCTTHMLNQSSQVIDVRNWTTTIAL